MRCQKRRSGRFQLRCPVLRGNTFFSVRYVHGCRLVHRLYSCKGKLIILSPSGVESSIIGEVSRVGSTCRGVFNWGVGSYRRYIHGEFMALRRRVGAW